MSDYSFREAGLPFLRSFGKKRYWQTDKKTGSEPHYHHHRQRLREKFMRSGSSALADYELMELILFRTIPRRDVKPLAKRILEAFENDFNKALSAPHSELIKIQGVGEAVAGELKIIEAAAHKFAQAKVMHKDVIASWDALMDYCKTAMAHRQTEQFRILFLDRKNTLIADEEQQKGTVDHVPVYPREVVKRALEINASALILVHNHPSGDPTPSQSDIDMTARIADAANSIGIEVHDHVIIGKEHDFSFKTAELL